MDKVLNNWIKQFNFGDVQRHKNVTFIPISTSKQYDIDFLTLSEGLDKKLVEILELEDGATVPEIKVKNKSDKYLIIFDGEHLIGAKQNRIVNKTVIVTPNSELVIPVSCTEQGRWHHVSEEFSRSDYNAPASIRKYAKQTKDPQHNVWNNISSKMTSFAVHSGTSSLNDIYEEIDLNFTDYKQKIHQIDSQIGFLVFINGSFYGIELVNNKHLFSELFDGIINGYLLDAIENNKDIEIQFDRENLIKRVIENLSKAKFTIAETIGMEKRETIKGKETIGEFVTFNRIPIHLAVFNRKEFNN